MAKRFTASDKWEDKWFRKLKPTHKLLWIYMLDRCDMAGVIENDMELAETYLGAKIDENAIDTIFRNRVFRISDSKLWIPKFIEFQYGCSVTELDRKKPLHQGVFKSIDRNRLTEFFHFLQYPMDTPNEGIHTLEVGVEVGVGVEVKEKNEEKTFFLDPSVNAAYIEWIGYRKEKKRPLTPSMIRKQMEFLKKQPDPVECINQSIRNGWQGLFEVKNGNGRNGVGQNQPKRNYAFDASKYPSLSKNPAQ